jgi:hypothetical protein
MLAAERAMRLIVALCMFIASLAAAAQPGPAKQLPLPAEHDGVRFLSGGEDEHARVSMRRAARGYSLRLSFTAGADRHHVSDVQVVVREASGDPFFDLPAAGPLLFLALPTGRYVVHARLGDVVHTRAFAVGGHPGRFAIFHWAEADVDG